MLASALRNLAHALVKLPTPPLRAASHVLPWPLHVSPFRRGLFASAAHESYAAAKFYSHFGSGGDASACRFSICSILLGGLAAVASHKDAETISCNTIRGNVDDIEWHRFVSPGTPKAFPKDGNTIPGLEELEKIAREAKQSSNSKKTQAKDIAMALKCIGAFNLAISVISLVIATVAYFQISKLRKAVPQLGEEVCQLEIELGHMSRTLDYILNDLSKLGALQDMISESFQRFEIKLKKFEEKAAQTIRDAKTAQERAKTARAVSDITAIFGFVVAVFSCGFDCGMGLGLGLSAVGTGVVGGVLSRQNIYACLKLMKEVESLKESASTQAELAEELINILIELDR